VVRDTLDPSYKEHSRLVRSLFTAYPHLAKSFDPADKRVNRFVKRQQHWMRKGFHERVAFDKTVTEFKDQIEHQRRSATLLKEVAGNNRARSFMDEYEQLAEYEGRLKVKRLATDLPKYLKSLPEFSQFQIPNALNSWEKMSFRFKNREGDLAVNGNIDDKELYFIKAKKLLEAHYEKANDLDGLRGLSDQLILWNARDAYRDVKKNAKQLFKALLEAGATIREDGQLDLSRVQNAELRETLKTSPVLKEILNSQGEIQDLRRGHQLPEELEESFRKDIGLGKPVLFSKKDPYKQNISKEDKESIETEEDRIQRLKGVYKQAKEYSNLYIEKGFLNTVNLHKHAVDKLRVVRRHLDQNLFAHNMEVTFEPHVTQMKTEDFLLDKDLDLDMMNTFLSLPEREVVRTEAGKLDYDTIYKLITPQDIIENTVPVGYETDNSVKQREVWLNLEAEEFSLEAEPKQAEIVTNEEGLEILDADIDMLYTDDFRDEENADMPLPEPEGKRRKGRAKTKKEIKDLQMRKAKLQSALSKLAKSKE
jgi:hypothetical protein